MRLGCETVRGAYFHEIIGQIDTLNARCKRNSGIMMADKFRNYPGMHLICVNEFDADGLGRLRSGDVHEVFDKVSSVYQRDIKDLTEILENVSCDVACVVATATGTMNQFNTVLKKAQESGKERVNMWGTFEGAMEKERKEAERNGKQEGERNGKKIPSLNMLKRGFDYKTAAEISEVSVDQVKKWEKENASPS